MIDSSEITPSPVPKSNLVYWAIPITLLFIQTSLFAYIAWSTVSNHTEVGHIGATVYLWHTGKLDVFHVNPPLVRAVAGASVDLFSKIYSPKYCNQPHSRVIFLLAMRGARYFRSPLIPSSCLNSAIEFLR